MLVREAPYEAYCTCVCILRSRCVNTVATHHALVMVRASWFGSPHGVYVPAPDKRCRDAAPEVRVTGW